jgi:hypothetical protein
MTASKRSKVATDGSLRLRSRIAPVRAAEKPANLPDQWVCLRCSLRVAVSPQILETSVCHLLLRTLVACVL